MYCKIPIYSAFCFWAQVTLVHALFPPIRQSLIDAGVPVRDWSFIRLEPVFVYTTDDVK